MRKAPQERKTAKKLTDRELGRPNIKLMATDEKIRLAEIGESQWPPTFRGEDEIRFLRDYCEAWLDHHEQEGEADE